MSTPEDQTQERWTIELTLQDGTEYRHYDHLVSPGFTEASITRPYEELPGIQDVTAEKIGEWVPKEADERPALDDILDDPHTIGPDERLIFTVKDDHVLTEDKEAELFDLLDDANLLDRTLIVTGLDVTVFPAADLQDDEEEAEA